MNQGMCIRVPRDSQYKLWTNGLCGCVATIIDIEHTNGDHSMCMCHCAYDNKEQNKMFIDAFFQKQDIKNIKKTSCILLPPGIQKKLVRTTLMPIFDPAWKNVLLTTIQKYVPHAKIVIKPYHFNELTSEIHYEYNAGSSAVQIIDKSSAIDEESIQQLLETHNYPTQDTQYKAALLPIIAGALIGCYIYCNS